MSGRAWGFVAGGVFGAGLALSGMTRPEKVLAFLDVASDWDPSLALVMVGAIGVHFAALRLGGARAADASGGASALRLDAPLVVGSALFGIGWGLAGYCPGPALVGVAGGPWSALVFAAAMAVGVLAHRAWRARRSGERLPARTHQVPSAVESREEADQPLAHHAA